MRRWGIQEGLDEVVRRHWGRPRTAWKEYVSSWPGGTNEGRTPITMLTTCFDLGYNVIKVALLTKVGHCHMWCGLFKFTCAKKCSAPVGFMTAHLLPVPSIKLLISSWFCVNENGNEHVNPTALWIRTHFSPQLWQIHPDTNISHFLFRWIIIAYNFHTLSTPRTKTFTGYAGSIFICLILLQLLLCAFFPCLLQFTAAQTGTISYWMQK